MCCHWARPAHDICSARRTIAIMHDFGFRFRVEPEVQPRRALRRVRQAHQIVEGRGGTCSAHFHVQHNVENLFTRFSQCLGRWCGDSPSLRARLLRMTWGHQECFARSGTAPNTVRPNAPSVQTAAAAAASIQNAQPAKRLGGFSSRSKCVCDFAVVM